MVSNKRAPHLAVLIDADNASAKIAEGLFEEIAKVDEASVRRIYGDFSGPRLQRAEQPLALCTTLSLRRNRNILLGNPVNLFHRR